MRRIVPLLLVLLPLQVLALDNTVCHHDIEQGYLGSSFANQISSQRQKVERFRDNASLTVTRAELKLTLRLKSGKAKTFRSIPCDGATQYNFEEHATAIGMFVVNALGWEDHDVLLVNDSTGKVTNISNTSLPAISPDGKYFAVYGNNVYSHNELQIWQVENRSPQMVWSVEPADYGHTGAVWKSNTEVLVSIAKTQIGLQPIPPYDLLVPERVKKRIRVVYVRSDG